MQNDGIFDWTAVEIAVQGARLPRLTWVEREVAAIALYAKGYQTEEIRERLGIPDSSSRWDRIRKMVGDAREVA